MLIQSALAAGEEHEALRQELAVRRNAGEKALRDRFRRARAEGELPAGADPADLARYVATVTRGLAVQASGGATRSQREAVAGVALRALPAPGE